MRSAARLAKHGQPWALSKKHLFVYGREPVSMWITQQHNISITVALWIVISFFSSSTLSAQTAENQRITVGFSGGIQFIKDALKNEVDFELWRETGTFEASYNVTTDSAFDGSLAFLLYKRMGLGFNVSHFSKTIAATIDADVPHPFFFSFPRKATGVANNILRRESAIHIQSQYWHTVGDKFLIRGFIGPTIFSVRQDLVSTIQTKERGYEDKYDDYSVVDIIGHSTLASGGTELGFNIGFDMSYFVFDHVALTGILRYSRGTSSVNDQATLRHISRFSGRGQPPLELGGTHVAAGLRFGF